MTTRKAPYARQTITPEGSSNKGGWNVQPPSERCKATHDVPYTLRCVLRFDHAWSGPLRLNPLSHQDKNGDTWGLENTTDV